ncbi:MAG: glycerophosphodiester phosphodiesterase family protein [Pseudomonadota bacterium]
MHSRLPTNFLSAPIAHRGLHDASVGVIENSLGAVNAAASAGYAIEVDVQRAACGEAMVFHDDHLDRLTARSGPVAALTAPQLGALALTGSDETIPTLGVVLNSVAGRVPLVVEVKDQTGCYGAEVGRLEARIAELLAGYSGPVAVMSFNPYSVAWFRDNAAPLMRGFVSCRHPAEATPEATQLSDLHVAPALDLDFISYDASALPVPPLDTLRTAGMPVISWTIRSDAEAARAYRHSDQITFEGFRPALP